MKEKRKRRRRRELVGAQNTILKMAAPRSDLHDPATGRCAHPPTRILPVHMVGDQGESLFRTIVIVKTRGRSSPPHQKLLSRLGSISSGRSPLIILWPRWSLHGLLVFLFSSPLSPVFTAFQIIIHCLRGHNLVQGSSLEESDILLLGQLWWGNHLKFYRGKKGCGWAVNDL